MHSKQTRENYMNQYRIVFESTDHPGLSGELIYNNQTVFDWDQAHKIADQENANIPVFIHRVEVAE
jgi:hypothetical protein